MKNQTEFATADEAIQALFPKAALPKVDELDPRDLGSDLAAQSLSHILAEIAASKG